MVMMTRAYNDPLRKEPAIMPIALANSSVIEWSPVIVGMKRTVNVSTDAESGSMHAGLFFAARRIPAMREMIMNASCAPICA